MKHMLRLNATLLLLFGLALVTQPAAAQELSAASDLALQERVIPDATLAAERFVTVTPDGSAEVISADADRPSVATSGPAPSGAWNGRGQEPLHDNGPVVNCEGCGAGGLDASRLQTSLQMNTLGANVGMQDGVDHFRIADDFFVPEGATWTIESVQVLGYQTGSDNNSSFTHVNVRIWDGFPDAPGSNLLFGDGSTNILLTTEFSQIYRDSENNPGLTNRPIMIQTADVDVELTEGHYYIDWQMGGTIASGPWQPPITINGLCETGDAWQLVSTGWQEWRDSGDAECWQGAPFMIFGDEKVVGSEENPQTATLALEAVHPNPVAGSATLSFTLPRAADVDLGVYDLLGRRVAVAAEGEFGAGEHSVGFDSTGLAAGIYVVRLTAGGEFATRRVTVVR